MARNRCQHRSATLSTDYRFSPYYFTSQLPRLKRPVHRGQKTDANSRKPSVCIGYQSHFQIRTECPGVRRGMSIGRVGSRDPRSRAGTSLNDLLQPEKVTAPQRCRCRMTPSSISAACLGDSFVKGKGSLIAVGGVTLCMVRRDATLAMPTPTTTPAQIKRITERRQDDGLGDQLVARDCDAVRILALVQRPTLAPAISSAARHTSAIARPPTPAACPPTSAPSCDRWTRPPHAAGQQQGLLALRAVLVPRRAPHRRVPVAPR